jgi:hypothetical protein
MNRAVLMDTASPPRRLTCFPVPGVLANFEENYLKSMTKATRLDLVRELTKIAFGIAAGGSMAYCKR